MAYDHQAHIYFHVQYFLVVLPHHYSCTDTISVSVIISMYFDVVIHISVSSNMCVIRQTPGCSWKWPTSGYYFRLCKEPAGGWTLKRADVAGLTEPVLRRLTEGQ